MFGLRADRQQGGVAQEGRSGQGAAAGAEAGSGSPGADWSSREAVTVISEDIVISGNITAQRPVCLEGTVEGDLKGDQVIIGKAGAVTGSIVANAVEVHGRVLGSIQSKSVMLYKTAYVEGDILHQGIGIEMGTHYDGRLKWDTSQPTAASAPFDPAHAAPKPIPLNAQGDRFEPQQPQTVPQAHPQPEFGARHEISVAYNAEATGPQN